MIPNKRSVAVAFQRLSFESCVCFQKNNSREKVILGRFCRNQPKSGPSLLLMHGRTFIGPWQMKVPNTSVIKANLDVLWTRWKMRLSANDFGRRRTVLIHFQQMSHYDILQPLSICLSELQVWIPSRKWSNQSSSSVLGPIFVPKQSPTKTKKSSWKRAVNKLKLYRQGWTYALNVGVNQMQKWSVDSA